MQKLMYALLAVLALTVLPEDAVAQDAEAEFYNCRLDQLPLGTSFPNAKLYYRAARCSHQPNNGFGTPWISNKSSVNLALPNAPSDARFETVWLPRVAAHTHLEAIDKAVGELKTGSLTKPQADTQIASALNALTLLMNEAPNVVQGISDGAQQLRVTADVSLDWPLQAMDLLILGYEGGAELSFLSLAKSRVSSSVYTIGISLLFALFGLWFLASGLLGYRVLSKDKKHEARWFAGANGRLSLANSQIALFSVVVFCLMLLQLLRSGVLIDLSTDVLYLIGIVSGGSALAKIAETKNQRLSWQNWLWLKQNGWFKAKVDYGPGQLVRDVHGSFDIPRLQAVAFSVLVAGYLVFEGYDGLAGIVIAPSILGVLGLSQFTYISGKAIAPPSWSDYDKQVTDFRTDSIAPGDDDYALKLKKLRDGFEAIFGYRPVNEIGSGETAVKLIFDQNTANVFPLRLTLDADVLATLSRPVDVYECRDLRIPDAATQFVLSEAGGAGRKACYPATPVKFPDQATQQFTVTSGDFS